jgi:predicted GTPase
MSRWRVLLVALLITVPFLVLAGLGSYFLWREGWGWIFWWPMAACLILGYVLAWYWQKRRQLLRPVDSTPPADWTERDLEAWKLVQARAAQTGKIDLATLGSFQFYTDTAQDMALELARFYHPKAQDPISSLTVPEILAVVELAAHDLADIVDNYLPGGHLLTIRDWRRAKQASDWYPTASNLYWLVSALFSPVNTGVRYGISKLGMSRPFQLLQENLVAWFYTAYVHRLGTYLIDLHSGRLRVGARRFRELRGDASAEPASPSRTTAATGESSEAADAAEKVGTVTITIVGQVKSGKSSFINALLGEQQAATDVLPITGAITRYELHPQGIPTRLILLDTVGYGHTGPTEDQRRATAEAARQSDLVLVVVHARNPARHVDREVLHELRQWFIAHPEWKQPPILGILTQIDLLFPAMEWAPPYDWVEPRRPKEHQIQQAWVAFREQLGDYLVGIVPVCTLPGKVYGINEWFLPTLTELLDEARAVALLRCLRAEANVGNVRKIFQQLVQVAKVAAKAVWESGRPRS